MDYFDKIKERLASKLKGKVIYARINYKEEMA